MCTGVKPRRGLWEAVSSRESVGMKSLSLEWEEHLSVRVEAEAGEEELPEVLGNQERAVCPGPAEEKD